MSVRDSSLEENTDSKLKGFGSFHNGNGMEFVKKAPCHTVVGIGSREWANRQLRFSIRILQGGIVRSTWAGRLCIALYIKDRLSEYGFSWQAKRIDNWIHRLQPKRADSERVREASFEGGHGRE